MSAFEYLSVFISIILGLAVVHLLGGVSLMLDQRVRARLDPIHFLWVVNMFTLITWIWWGNWQLVDIEIFSSLHYVAMVLFSVVVYLMCGLLFPVRGKEVEDFSEQFEMNRARFFYLGLALMVAAALKGHVDRLVLEQPDTVERAIALVFVGALFITAASTRQRAFHGIFAVAFFLLLLRLIFTE